MRLITAVMTAVTFLFFTDGLIRAVPMALDAGHEVGENLPLISPDLIWEQQLPGDRRAEPPDPKALVSKELGGAIQADVTAVVDLSGDGQPEIVTAAQHGSGAVLALQVLVWDRQRVWTAFAHKGAREPGLFGWFDAEGDGRRELWIDTSTARGLFTGTTHGPFLRDRLVYRWERGTYQQVGRYRYATPFYHLNRYLYFASKGDWLKASRHAEPGVEVDRSLAAQLGVGGEPHTHP